MRSVSEMVRNGQKVHFVRYRQGNLWYATECGFEFPVPVADAADATFLAEDKASYFMRYIRPHCELVARARSAQVD